MDFLKYAIPIICFLFYFIILILAVRTKKAFKFLFLNAAVGLAVFLLLYFTKSYTGIFLPLNKFTAISTMLFGIPAIIGILVLNFIF